MTVANSKQLPRRYYGLHMVEGVAEYKEKGNNYRIFIGENTIKNMDPTFEGKPVYVKHVDTVDLENLQAEADGYVVRSFFNQADGKHWVEFLVVSDKGHEAVKKGWKLSNAYLPKDSVGGGQWHGVDYRQEVVRGEYEHLAIVQNPRYEESVIMTPEQFKKYNDDKTVELKRLVNEKQETKKMKFSWFKKAKVENEKEAMTDLEAMVVALPASKVEMTIAEMVEKCDSIQNMSGYANDEHMVKAGDEEMSVKEMNKRYCQMKKMNDEKEMADKEAKEKDEKKNKKNEKTPEEIASEKAESERVENEKKLEAAKKAAEGMDFFDTLKNAKDPNAIKKNEQKLELPEDAVKRGISRYGSGK